jgi:succinate dehydrogenase/fumarate reductase flavoprotein subunit
MNEEELRHRIKNAIVLLADGHTFKVGDLTFGCQNKNHFSVTGWTVKNDLKNITKETALTELSETKELFIKMISFSPELAEFLNGREIEYCLGFDYGMGGLEICTETNGQLKWTIALTK